MILVASSRSSSEFSSREALLDVRADQAFVHRQDDDLVVGQQPFCDGPAEAPVEQGLAVKALVVHRRQIGIVLVGLAS